MPIGSTIKRITVCTLILCVLTALMCLGCKSQEDLALPVVVEVPTQTPIPFPTLVPLTSTIPIEPKEENLSTAEVVKLLKPSVVHIATGSVSMVMLGQEIPRTGLGSGLVLDTEGRILTNNHVVDNAQVITATLGDGRSYPASLLGADPVTDLAVIQINAAQLEPARLGNSSKIEVGEDVIAVGHALGLKGGPTVSKGVVSAVNRTIPRSVYTSMIGLIQTDASINPGNSGGPLVNMKGEVIGINTGIIDDSNGIGFAINIDDAKTIVGQLIKFGLVNRGFIGITSFDVTDSIREQINLPVAEGVIIAGIVPNYPADLSGLKVEDVIIKLDEVDISNSGDLSKYLIAHPPGSEVVVTVYRDGSLLSVELTLASGR